MKHWPLWTRAMTIRSNFKHPACLLLWGTVLSRRATVMFAACTTALIQMCRRWPMKMQKCFLNSWRCKKTILVLSRKCIEIYQSFLPISVNSISSCSCRISPGNRVCKRTMEPNLRPFLPSQRIYSLNEWRETMTISSSSSSSSNSSSLRSRSNSASKSCLLAKDTSCRNIIYQSLRLLLQSHRWLYLCEPSTPTQSWITVPGCDSQVFKTASFFACLVGRTYRICRHVLGLNLDLAHNALVSQRIRVRYIRSLRVATRQI